MPTFTSELTYTLRNSIPHTALYMQDACRSHSIRVPRIRNTVHRVEVPRLTSNNSNIRENCINRHHLHTCFDKLVIKLVALGIGFPRSVATGGARYYDDRLCRNIIFTSVGQIYSITSTLCHFIFHRYIS